MRKSFSFAAVRHPFRRLVSCYCNKKFWKKSYSPLPELELMKYKYNVESGSEEPNVLVGPWIRRAISHSSLTEGRRDDGSLLAHYLSASGNEETQEELDTNHQGSVSDGPARETDFRMSEFRDFVFRVTWWILSCESDPSCIGSINNHMMPQVVRWNPCIINFDMIMKTETLDRDVKLMSDLLGLPVSQEQVEDNQIGRSGKAAEVGRNEDLENGEIEKELRRKRAVDQNDVGTGPVQTTVVESAFVGERKLASVENLSQNKSSQSAPAVELVRKNMSYQKCQSYEDHMKQLSQRDIDLLFTAYYLDFKLFGYDPFE